MIVGQTESIYRESRFTKTILIGENMSYLLQVIN